jgi:putative salt-induced outer membrane protein YdiY
MPRAPLAAPEYFGRTGNQISDMNMQSLPARIKLALAAVLAAGVALSFPSTVRAQTNAPAAVPPPPPPKWESTASLGFTVTGGNTRTMLATANFDTQHKSPDNEFLFGGDGTYGKDTTGTNDVKSAESLHGSAQYNRLITERLFYGLRLDGLHDAVAGINYRFTASPLMGYYLIKSTNTSMVTELGPGYVYERQTGQKPDGNAILRLGEKFEHKFTPGTKLWQSVEILPRVNKFSNYYLDGEIGVDTALTKHTGLTTYVVDNYYSVPTPGRLKNDIKLVSGLKIKF